MAQAPHQTVFKPPDGHWWLAASEEARDGFAVGEDDCDAFFLHHAGPLMSRLGFESAISAFYHRQPGKLSLPVMTVISTLQRRWRAAGTYRFITAQSSNEYNGDMWWPPSPDNRDGLIRGFLACQAAEVGARITVPVNVLIQRVSKWYGIDPHKEGVVNPATIHDRLSTVILHAEKQGS